MLHQLKSLLRDGLGLPPVAVHVAVGLVAHLMLNLLLRKSATSAWGLLAPLLIGIAVESWEIWIQYREVGLTAAGNDPVLVILARHALDVVAMLAAPTLLVVAGALSSRA